MHIKSYVDDGPLNVTGAGTLTRISTASVGTIRRDADRLPVEHGVLMVNKRRPRKGIAPGARSCYRCA